MKGDTATSIYFTAEFDYAVFLIYDRMSVTINNH